MPYNPQNRFIGPEVMRDILNARMQQEQQDKNNQAAKELLQMQLDAQPKSYGPPAQPEKEIKKEQVVIFGPQSLPIQPQPYSQTHTTPEPIESSRPVPEALREARKQYAIEQQLLRSPETNTPPAPEVETEPPVAPANPPAVPLITPAAIPVTTESQTSSPVGPPTSADIQGNKYTLAIIAGLSINSAIMLVLIVVVLLRRKNR